MAPSSTEASRRWGRYDLLPERIAVFTTRGRLSYANRAWLEAAEVVPCPLLSSRNLRAFARDGAADAQATASRKGLAEGLERLLSGRTVSMNWECSCSSVSQAPLSCRVRGQLHEVAGRPALVVLHDDLSDRRRAEQHLRAVLADRETLLREVHHRVKNNLQVISSLLALQLRAIDSDAARAALVATRMRVRAIAAVHERLCESEDLARLDLGEYIRSLVQGILSSAGGDGAICRLVIETDVVPVSLDDAVRCGLIVNELVSNALEHGFKGRSEGHLSITLRRLDDERARLTVADDGVGLPSDVDPVRTDSLGLHLAAGLAQRLGSCLEVERHHGTTFSLVVRTQVAS